MRLKVNTNGYASKLLANAFNSLELTVEDCGTEEFLLVRNFNPSEFKFRYVRLSNSKHAGIYEVLNDDNKSKYEGKTVEVRSPMFCQDTSGICQKCAGDLHKYNGVKKNLSAYPISLSADIMNKSMKAFHSLEAKYTKINFKNHFKK